MESESKDRASVLLAGDRSQLFNVDSTNLVSALHPKAGLAAGGKGLRDGSDQE